ncbi:hypothetical protein [Burkholderia gladioli]|uniref:hypothetical protein n=1 Tax=Burkholderia gladioli TaxID=28095 RepID=UPI00163E1C56|nr:hypothetical protein [Burkholderia gladioli]
MDDIDRLFQDRRRAVELRNQEKDKADQAALDAAADLENKFSSELKPFVLKVDEFFNKMRAKIEGAGGVFHGDGLPPLPMSFVREVLVNVALPIRTGKRAPTFGFSVSVDGNKECAVSMFEKYSLGQGRTEIFQGSLDISLGRIDAKDVMPEIEKLFLSMLTHAWDKTEPLL